MALTNLPYDDSIIAREAAALGPGVPEVRDVAVDFLSDDTTETGTATITVTSSWKVSAADALRILDAARP